MNKKRKYNFKRGDIVNGAIFIKELDYNHKDRRGLFLCACGNLHETSISNAINRGRIKCTQCFHAELSVIRTSHGGCVGGGISKSYLAWCHIKQRCYNENSQFYYRYGGRGIVMHEPWIDDPSSFMSYVESLPGYGELPSIDRIEKNGNYVPNNMRWADWETQAINRNVKSTNKTGFTGVAVNKRKFDVNYIATIGKEYIGVHDSILAAAEARDWYIIKNGLWQYPLQVIRKTA